MGILRPPAIERITNGARVISTDHANLHDGEAFAASFYVDGLADEAKYYYQFTTCADTAGYVHFKDYRAWTNGAKVRMRIYEDPTAAPTGGTVAAPVCRNRNNGSSACATSKYGVTANIAGADLIEVTTFGGGGATPSSRSGGDSGIDTEIVMVPSTTYLFEFENLSGAAADINFWAFWYEEEYGLPDVPA